MPLLSIIIFLPLFFAFGILFVQNEKIKKILALFVSIVQLVLLIFLSADYNLYTKSYQFVEKRDWITLDLGSMGRLSIDYFIGVDGLSFPLLWLNAIIFFVAILASYNIGYKTKGYYALLLLMMTSINGCFLALDFFLFFLFFEFMLLPMYFLILIWGGARREYASIKFFLYTLLGSLLILIVMIGLYMSVEDPVETIAMTNINQFVHTFRLDYLSNTKFYIPDSLLHPNNSGGLFGFSYRHLAFLLLLLGFAVKLPSVPFHTWLPDAHVEAPTPISVILAAILLKVGGYGLIRIAYGIFPKEALYFSNFVAILGAVSIVYGAYCALAQSDLKKMIAYSSVSHMGFVLLGLAAFNTEGVSGSIFMMVSHGFISAALFLIVGVLYEQTHNRLISDYHGLVSVMPRFTVVTSIVFFASLGLPTLSGFIAEMLVLFGAFKSILVKNYLAMLATMGLLIGAGYYLWTLQKMFFGKFELAKSLEGTKLKDLNSLQVFYFSILIIFMFLLGIQPHILLDITNVSVNELIK